MKWYRIQKGRLVGARSIVGINWVPAATAARMLCVSRQRIYVLCDQGKLQAQDMDGTVLVSLGSIKNRLSGFELTGGNDIG